LQIKGLDINVLFGNLSDVVKVTEELLAQLETNQMEIGKELVCLRHQGKEVLLYDYKLLLSKSCVQATLLDPK